MADKTGIEWTDATWNPVRGCSRVSEGCRNCYAEVMAARFSDPGQWGHGFAKRVTLRGGGKDHRWTGKVALVPDQLDQLLRWRRPRKVFANSTSDLFHEELDELDIAMVWAYAMAADWHTIQVLTKRPERAMTLLNSEAFREIVEAFMGEVGEVAGRLGLYDPLARRTDDWRARAQAPSDVWPARHIWLGVSVEDQATADERIPLLLQTPAAKRFISAEPLLGPVDLWPSAPCPNAHQIMMDPETGAYECCSKCDYTGVGDEIGIDWVIAGGESGPNARPMHPDWARDLRDQCAAAGVPFFFKQWGEYVTEDQSPLDITIPGISSHLLGDDQPSFFRVGKKAAGALLDGREHREFPQGETK